MVKSPLKYIGGKAKLINNGKLKFPEEYGDYYEPFCGGLTPFFSLIKDNVKDNNKNYYLSDNSENLVNFFQVIKKRPHELIDEIKLNVNLNLFLNTSTCYYTCRKRFNELSISENPIEKAALFLYLNKTGFNGMYRENKKGEYNIPFGRMKLLLFDYPGILNINAILTKENVHLTCQDYKNINPKKGDLVYLDPPYYDTFSGYSKSPFGELEHVQLQEKIVKWKSIGVIVILSNSDTEFIRKLYSDSSIFTIEKVPIRYSISSGTRVQNYELIIS